MSVLKLENINYKYPGASKNVLNNISYEFQKGKVYSIVGRSGTGKTTLLSLMSGLAEPTEGRICLNEEDISKINKYLYRSKYVGVIFQSFNLLPKYTALENVELSMDIANVKGVNKKEKALELLNKMGLDNDEANRRILKLSGGQQQRVAIARTLSYGPEIILADEPTGNLDKETQAEIIEIFKELAHKENKCIILVTHSKEVSEQSDVVYKLA